MIFKNDHIIPTPLYSIWKISNIIWYLFMWDKIINYRRLAFYLWLFFRHWKGKKWYANFYYFSATLLAGKLNHNNFDIYIFISTKRCHMTFRPLLQYLPNWTNTKYMHYLENEKRGKRTKVFRKYVCDIRFSINIPQGIKW